MNTEFSPAELTRRDSERLRRYKELLGFYQGVQWEGREKRNEKRLTFNYARTVIDKTASYLMSGTSMAVEPAAGTASANAGEAENALLRIAEENSLAQLDFETEIDCSIMGDACYKVIWDTAEKRIRITAPDIQGIYVWSAGDDAAHIQRVASGYSISSEAAASLYRIRTKEKTVRITEVWTDVSFELWADETLAERKPNPYGFIPFIIFPNLREPKQFWGVSDLAGIMEPQRELNRATSQLSRILELSGNPIAVLENVEESQDIAVRPGAVWNIPEDAKAYLLDLLQGGGVSLHMDYISLLFRMLHDISESPRTAFGGTERDLSGVALEIDLQPLLQKVKRKRIIRSGVYVRRARMALRLLEKFGGAHFGDINIRTVWGALLPRDITALVGNEQTMIQNGIHSRRRAMEELGIIDPEVEFTRWLEERERILKMNLETGSAAAGIQGER